MARKRTSPVTSKIKPIKKSPSVARTPTLKTKPISKPARGGPGGMGSVRGGSVPPGSRRSASSISKTTKMKAPGGAAKPLSKPTLGTVKPKTFVQKVAGSTVRGGKSKFEAGGKKTAGKAAKHSRANITALEKKRGRKLTQKERRGVTERSTARTMKRRAG